MARPGPGAAVCRILEPMTTRWDDVAGLVAAARDGNEEAFRELLQSHRDAITSTLFACGVRCPETARDLGQDVALRAGTRLDTLADPRCFTACFLEW